MSKFWTAAAILLIVGLVVTFYPSNNGIDFTDLETECQYDRDTMTQIDLQHNRLRFQGHFPVEDPESDLSHDYRVGSDEIVLNIKSSNLDPLTDFYNNCKAVAVYDARTDKIEDGYYIVNIEHNGERVERRVIEIG